MSFNHPYAKDGIKYQEPLPVNASKEQIREFAEDIANQLQYYPGDDLENYIEKLGGKVKILDAEQWADVRNGSILVHDEMDFDIFLPNFTGHYRDRFTIAHEMGHYFLHSEQGKIPIYVERLGSDTVEWEANWFAAAFLMPEIEVRKKFSENDNINLLAAYFGVSKNAMSVRLQVLNLK